MIDFYSKVEELPISAGKDLYDYAINLSIKFNKKKKSKAFKLDWVGDLSELYSQYNSIELQHQISNMWIK